MSDQATHETKRSAWVVLMVAGVLLLIAAVLTPSIAAGRPTAGRHPQVLHWTGVALLFSTVALIARGGRRWLFVALGVVYVWMSAVSVMGGPGLREAVRPLTTTAPMWILFVCSGVCLGLAHNMAFDVNGESPTGDRPR